jgi:chromate reductase
MAKYQVGYFVGSLSSTSINRELSQVLIRLAPEDLEFTEIPIGNLPLYSQDYDANYPREATALKDAIRRSDAVLFVTPEYNRSIPGALKNAIDWASRPWGENAFDHIPAGVIGASIGQIGTAVAQQSLRAVLSFCNARQMTAPEAYISFAPRDLSRRRRVRPRIHHGLPEELHGRVPRPCCAGPDRPASSAITASTRHDAPSRGHPRIRWYATRRWCAVRRPELNEAEPVRDHETRLRVVTTAVAHVGV